MTSKNDTSKRWWPWQVSLRMLLMAVLAVSCFLSGWATRDREAKREFQRFQLELERLRQVTVRYRDFVPRVGLDNADGMRRYDESRRHHGVLINDLPPGRSAVTPLQWQSPLFRFMN